MQSVTEEAAPQNHPPTAVSEENLEFLKEAGRRDIAGPPKPLLKRFEQQLLAGDWREVT